MTNKGWYVIWLLVFVFGLMFSTVAKSREIVIRTPPAQFLMNPDTGWLVVRVFSASSKEIFRICNQMYKSPEPIGCTDTVQASFNRKVCTIFIVNNYDDQSKAVVMRHQRAHCFGWRHYF